jgi:hypothetical protein
MGEPEQPLDSLSREKYGLQKWQRALWPTSYARGSCHPPQTATSHSSEPFHCSPAEQPTPGNCYLLLLRICAPPPQQLPLIESLLPRLNLVSPGPREDMWENSDRKLRTRDQRGASTALIELRRHTHFFSTRKKYWLHFLSLSYIVIFFSLLFPSLV